MAVTFKSRSSKLTLAITAQPTTTEYLQGDSLNLTGIQVMATRRDGTPVDVTSSCTFSPSNGSTISSSGTITVTANYHGKSAATTVTSYAIDRIAVTTPPTQTSFGYGDTISYSGIVVKAYANNDSIERDVTSQCTYNPANGAILTEQAGTHDATITWRTKSTTQSYRIIVKIYGAQWSGGSSSAWTRTDDASSFSSPSPAVNNGNGSSPFDNILPWSGVERVVEGGQNQVLVKIPKFYYKWTRSGSSMKLQISMSSFVGSHVSPAHADRGDGSGERDYVYVGAYPCANVPSASLFHYRSLSGRTPITNITRATARSNIHSYVGENYWQWDYAMYWTICMLYLVEYADWNVQAKIGFGNVTLQTTGQTDSMRYHTGTSATKRTNNGHVRYRYIEDLWTNCWSWIDGNYVTYSSKSQSYSTYIILNPSNFNDSSGGTSVGTKAVSDTGAAYVTGWTSNPSSSNYMYAILPSSVDSSLDGTTYCCDSLYDELYTSGTGSLAVGGIDYSSFSSGNGLGLFDVSILSVTTQSSEVGCRLMKLP